jgi:glycosyltransferase involved in cell wall biosynthesis
LKERFSPATPVEPTVSPAVEEVPPTPTPTPTPPNVAPPIIADQHIRSGGALEQCFPAVYSYLMPPNSPGKSYSGAHGIIPNFKNLTIHWVTPDFEFVSGGMRNIFELIHYLETKGHTNRFYVFGQTHYQSGEHARQSILQNYCKVDAQVFLGIDNMPVPDILISAGWQTAWAAHYHLEARKKFYLVQDYEPYFYSMGSDHVLSEQPLRFGMYGLSLGPWAKKVAVKFGMRSTSFDFAADHATFYPKEDVKRKKNSVIFYGRFVTPRRAYELGVVALYHVKRDRPDTEIIFHGWHHPSGPIPFDYINLGIMPDEKRAQLYREATIGMALSLTNPSMVPLEMMACKLPVVELKGDHTMMFYGKDYEQFINLAEISPRKIADAIIELLDNEEKRIALGEGGYEFTVNRTWPKAGAVVERALIRELKRELGLLGNKASSGRR